MTVRARKNTRKVESQRCPPVLVILSGLFLVFCRNILPVLMFTGAGPRPVAAKDESPRANRQRMTKNCIGRQECASTMYTNCNATHPRQSRIATSCIKKVHIPRHRQIFKSKHSTSRLCDTAMPLECNLVELRQLLQA